MAGEAKIAARGDGSRRAIIPYPDRREPEAVEHAVGVEEEVPLADTSRGTNRGRTGMPAG